MILIQKRLIPRDISLVREEVKGQIFLGLPSFSGWCDKDGEISADDCLDTVDQTVEDFHFKLPLVQQVGKGHLNGERDLYRKFQEEIMQMNNNEDGASAHGLRNENGKSVPFDIEIASGKEQTISNHGNNDFNSTDDYAPSKSKSKSSISAVDVLKTLSFILVWYTFSTSLTL